MLFVMAGGGTGGHIVPSIAVAGELRRRGHEALFIGTREGMEARLVPAVGFPIEWITIGGLKRVGLAQTARTLWQLPASVARCLSLLESHAAAAVFSMGGYVAGPVMLAAKFRRVPTVLMEPNAMPGVVSRVMGRFVRRALVSFDEARAFFPPGVTERTGLPVREAFFEIPPRVPGEPFTVLITGGSRGSQALNRACRDAWPRFQEAGGRVRFVVQSGQAQAEELGRAFTATGLPGTVTPFLEDMPGAYAQADLIVSRSGAGAVAELAAAGKPSILVPFPHAADDHQTHNARAMQRAGAAVLVPEADFSGSRLFDEVSRLRQDPAALSRMGSAARSLAQPGAAARAADLLLEIAGTH